MKIEPVDTLLIDLLASAINLLSLIPIGDTFNKLLQPLSQQQATLLTFVITVPWLHTQLSQSINTQTQHIATQLINTFKLFNCDSLTTVLTKYSNNIYHNAGIDSTNLLWSHLIDVIGECVSSEHIIMHSMLLCDIITCIDGGVWCTQQSTYINSYQYHILQLIDILTVNQFSDCTIIHSQFHSQQMFQRIGKFATHDKIQLNELALQLLTAATQRIHGVNSERWIQQLNTWSEISNKYESGYTAVEPQTPVSRLLSPYVKQQNNKPKLQVSISTQTRGSDMTQTQSKQIFASPIKQITQPTQHNTPERVHEEIVTNPEPLSIIVDGIELDEESVLKYDDRRTSMPNGQLKKPDKPKSSVLMNKMHQALQSVYSSKLQQPAARKYMVTSNNEENTDTTNNVQHNRVNSNAPGLEVMQMVSMPTVLRKPKMKHARRPTVAHVFQTNTDGTIIGASPAGASHIPRPNTASVTHTRDSLLNKHNTTGTPSKIPTLTKSASELLTSVQHSPLPM